MKRETIEYQFRPSMQTGGGWTACDYVCYITAPNGVMVNDCGFSKGEALRKCREKLKERLAYHMLSDIQKLKRCVTPKLEHTHLYEAVELIAKILIKEHQRT